MSDLKKIVVPIYYNEDFKVLADYLKSKGLSTKEFETTLYTFMLSPEEELRLKTVFNDAHASDCYLYTIRATSCTENPVSSEKPEPEYTITFLICKPETWTKHFEPLELGTGSPLTCYSVDDARYNELSDLQKSLTEAKVFHLPVTAEKKDFNLSEVHMFASPKSTRPKAKIVELDKLKESYAQQSRPGAPKVPPSMAYGGISGEPLRMFLKFIEASERRNPQSDNSKKSNFNSIACFNYDDYDFSVKDPYTTIYEFNKSTKKMEKTLNTIFNENEIIPINRNFKLERMNLSGF